MGPFVLGLAASLFFSLTFVLNRSMDLGGGFWTWSGVLRYLFMAPLLALLVPFQGGWKPLWHEVRKAPLAWWGWSTVGFGLFYAPLCAAAAFGEGWLIAALWQLTIVAGTILFPSGEGRRALLVSGFILVGVGLLTVPPFLAGTGSGTQPWVAAALVVVGAVAYPLGNRRLMALSGGRLSTVQRVTAMTLLSLPFWAVLALGSWFVGRGPTLGQTGQSLLVALFSGVVATLLFFRATDRAHGDAALLGAVEATQAGEVVFSLLGEVLVLGAPWPGPWSWAGLALVVGGMTFHSLRLQKPLAGGPKSG